MQFDLNNLEDTMFSFLDQFKVLFSGELWDNLLMNVTKNEMFVLMWLYRHDGVNMSSIAEYLNVPLNTATGIVGRMEKKAMVRRVRSEQDKRVVTIEITETGHGQINLIMKEYFKYAGKILGDLTIEEMDILNKLMTKVVSTLQTIGEEEAEPVKKVRKITID